MAFEEFTVQLPVGSGLRRDTMEIDVQVDVDTHEAIDIYITRPNYEDLPAALKKLEWIHSGGKNSLFVHIAPGSCAKAWTYLRKHAFLDEELEALLNS